MLPYLLAAVLLLGVPTIYLAIRCRGVRKFLAGAFFVSGGIQLYFFLIKVPIPFFGTDLVQTPELSAIRGIIHLVLAAVNLYFGFIWRRNPAS